MKRVFHAFLALVMIGVCTVVTAAQPADPLPSWNDGDIKQAIIRFVTSVTKEGSPDFVSPEQRIATFDNDGTLWAEQPVVQLEFVSYQIKKMAPKHPEWRSENPYKAILEGDTEYLINDYMNNHGKELFELVLDTHAGMTVSFQRNGARFLT